MTVGATETFGELDIPYRVAINESVELAKSFGGTDGHKWVNGVLDKVAPILRADEAAAQQAAREVAAPKPARRQ